MKVSDLGLIVSISGVIFFAASLVIILLGKKVGEGGSQKITVGKYVDLRTNSVLTLILISAFVLVIPLVLPYWKPDLSEYVHKDELSREYLRLQDVTVAVYGSAILEGGIPADNVDIEVVRTHEESVDTLRTETDVQGAFNIKLKKPKPTEQYRITWHKTGYSPIRMNFGFNEIPQTLIFKHGGN